MSFLSKSLTPLKRGVNRPEMPLDFSQHGGTLSSTARRIGVRKEDLSNYLRGHKSRVGNVRRRAIRAWLVANGFIKVVSRPRCICPVCYKSHARKPLGSLIKNEDRTRELYRELFDYFGAEHNILLLPQDTNEILNIIERHAHQQQ